MTTQDTPRAAVPDRLIPAAKYILIAALALFTAAMFAISGSDQPFASVAKSIEQTIDACAMQKRQPKDLRRCFGLNPADYDGVLLYQADSYLSAEELLLIRVKDESQMQEIRDAVQKRIENRKKDFKGYLPDQAAVMEHAQVVVRGRYLFFAASKDAGTYKTAFLKSL